MGDTDGTDDTEEGSRKDESRESGAEIFVNLIRDMFLINLKWHALLVIIVLIGIALSGALS